MTDDPLPSVDPDDPELALREARQRFIADFSAKCDVLSGLVRSARTDPDASIGALRHGAHRIAGLAGTVGFPALSAAASDLEAVCNAAAGGNFDAEQADRLVAVMRGAFTEEITTVPSWAAIERRAERAAIKVLVADDDEMQRQLVVQTLRAAGLVPIAVPCGDLVLDTVRAERPDLVLLDVNMPGLDGYGVCRQLKAAPDVSQIPVMFITTRGGLDERLAGLTLGADDYLIKPVDMPELLLRIQLLQSRRAAANATGPTGADLSAGELTYDRFVEAAREVLAARPAAVVLLRLPAGRPDVAAAMLRDNVRRRDIIGRYNSGVRVLLMPGMSAEQACDRIGEVVDDLSALGPGAHAGVAAAGAASSASLEALVTEADEALAEARYLDRPAAVRSPARADGPRSARCVVVAEDDPEVIRIVDAQLRAAGYQTVLAFDGDEALSAVTRHAPDALLLDLMMPRRTGFEVLSDLRQRGGRRPRVIVLSARGRADDVTRAFELGADDYMTKPFNPQELLARLARLLR